MKVRLLKSIRALVRLGLPFDKYLESLFTQQLLHRNLSSGDWSGNLTVYEVIVELNLRGILTSIAVKYTLEASPVYRRQTHWAWFTTGIEFTIVEPESPQSPARFADGVNFRVRGGIIRRSNFIPTAPDDFTAPYYNGAERAAAILPHRRERDANGFTHELGVHGRSVPALTAAGNCLPPS